MAMAACCWLAVCKPLQPNPRHKEIAGCRNSTTGQQLFEKRSYKSYRRPKILVNAWRRG